MSLADDSTVSQRPAPIRSAFSVKDPHRSARKPRSSQSLAEPVYPVRTVPCASKRNIRHRSNPTLDPQPPFLTPHPSPSLWQRTDISPISFQWKQTPIVPRPPRLITACTQESHTRKVYVLSGQICLNALSKTCPNPHPFSPLVAFGHAPISCDVASAGTPSRHSRTCVTPVAVRYGPLTTPVPFSCERGLLVPLLE